MPSSGYRGSDHERLPPHQAHYYFADGDQLSQRGARINHGYLGALAMSFLYLSVAATLSSFAGNIINSASARFWWISDVSAFRSFAI